MIVIKIGGGRGIDPAPLCEEVAALRLSGRRLVLVHGGSERTSELGEALGHPPRFITSPSGVTSRRTDRRTLEIFTLACAGSINPTIVARLQGLDVNALGLAGIDGGLWRGTRRRAIRVVEGGRERVIRDDYSGRVTRVNTALLENLLDAGFLPVLSPPALSERGDPINVDADRAAAATAAALGAHTLVILSNVPGLLRDPDDPTTLIRRVMSDELERVGRVARGRMRIKLLGAREALDGGVARVIIADARRPTALRAALDGEGTLIERTTHAEVSGVPG